MAFTDDYSAFRVSVSTWLDWTDSTTTHINDLIQVGENKLLKQLRVREMEAALAVTLNTAGQATIPADYLELKNAYLDTSPLTTLERVPLEQLYRAYPNRSQTSTKRLIAREGANFVLGGSGSGGDLLKGSYYAKPTSIVSAGTINSLFSAYPECYLFAALSEAEPFIGRDARVQLWQAKFSECVTYANEQDKDEWLSGSPITMRVG